MTSSKYSVQRSAFSEWFFAGRRCRRRVFIPSWLGRSSWLGPRQAAARRGSSQKPWCARFCRILRKDFYPDLSILMWCDIHGFSWVFYDTVIPWPTWGWVSFCQLWRGPQHGRECSPKKRRNDAMKILGTFLFSWDPETMSCEWV